MKGMQFSYPATVQS